MSQEQEKEKIPEKVFILCAVVAIVGLVTALAGVAVVLERGRIETVNYFQIIGGWALGAVSMFFFGKYASIRDDRDYFKILKDTYNRPLVILRKLFLKKQDE